MSQSLIIFASGIGTNAKAIIEYFSKREDVSVALIVSDNPNAGVLNMAQEKGVPTRIINRQTLHSEDFTAELSGLDPDLIVLAGFLKKIPELMVRRFPNKIINIHPALLPKYGGKGMYGMHVHQAVISAKEKESGITIHYVNEHYDEGSKITQAYCPVTDADSPETLAQKIHQLEHYYFPRTIDFLLKN